MKRIMNFLTTTAAIVFFFVCVFSAYSSESGKTNQPVDYQKALTEIYPDFMITPDEAYDWHLHKDKGGPTYSGNASWQSYISLIEKKLNQYGAVDITRNKWTYNRWYTSDWPDDSNWTLVSDGQPVKVAHYGAYSGSTGAEGITAEMVLYTPNTPMESLKGKIVVFRTALHPRPPLDEKYKKWFTLNDYEYRNEADNFPQLFGQVPPSQSVSYDVWWQLRTVMVYKVLRKSQAAGGVVVFNMGYDRLSGLYSFPVLPHFNAPNLYVDRVSGAKVIQDAKVGKQATIKLLAKVEPAETYQLIGYLPGQHYGTKQDEKILLTSHTDGPAVLQDNGAYWATTARINTFNKEHFVSEVAAMSQLTGELMLADF